MSFFTRTKHLDRHVALRLRDYAKRQLARNKKDPWVDEDDPCGDIKRTRHLASLFSPTHADTEVIWDMMNSGDTAWRESVPRIVHEIIEENRFIQ
jgi:hypothetical protein